MAPGVFIALSFCSSRVCRSGRSRTIRLGVFRARSEPRTWVERQHPSTWARRHRLATARVEASCRCLQDSAGARSSAHLRLRVSGARIARGAEPSRTRSNPRPPLYRVGGSSDTAAKKLGPNVALGYTGRMGIGIYSVVYGHDTISQYTGMEVGYLGRGASAKFRAGKQSGFAVREVDGDRVAPRTVPITNDIFEFGGGVWRLER